MAFWLPSLGLSGLHLALNVAVTPAPHTLVFCSCFVRKASHFTRQAESHSGTGEIARFEANDCVVVCQLCQEDGAVQYFGGMSNDL